MVVKLFCNFARHTSLLSVLLACALAGPAIAEEDQQATDVVGAISEGDVNFQFRYRFEDVDQDNPLDDANASTLKSRITYQTKPYKGFAALLEVDDITQLGDGDHNNTRNGETDHSVVADPEGTEINQAWISYAGVADTMLKYGRQRANFDNQRFIGGVGWRQNEQTYDAFSIANTALQDTTIVYAFINNVNRIFGPDRGTPPEDLDTKTHTLNVGYAGLPFGKLSAYAYLLEIDDAEALSNATYGARFDGKHELGDRKTALLYTAEYAMQEDYGDNPASYDADYYLLEAGVTFNAVTAKLGWEVLQGDSDNGAAFVTPLATLHPFQGWADQFLATPVTASGAGIEDFYVSASAVFRGTNLTVVYHDFAAEQGSADWGNEIDISLAHTFGKHVTGLLKYANYDADEHSVDTEKLWAQVVVSF
ncbi:MAG: alginate export family protein [Pseudomonadales bacterium]